MSTLVHQIIGEEKLRTICIRAGLTSEDQTMVDEILGRWITANLSGESLEKKVKVAFEIIGDNPHRKKIIETLLLISIEYLYIRTKDLCSEANAS